MKKIIALLLILILIPACACAKEKDPSFYYGTWISSSTVPDGRYTIVAFHFAADGVVYFTRDIFIDGNPYENVQEVRSWEVTSYGVRILNPDGSVTEFHLYTDDFLGNRNGYIIYGYTRLTPVKIYYENM